jgi:pilus assembly protein CpaB
MNRSRIIVLVLAAFAAGAHALIVRGFIGGGTEQVRAAIAPSPTATINVLVAATQIQPGTALTPDLVRWQSWPKSSVDSSFISQEGSADASSIVKGTVARAPMLEGEPLTNTKIIHGDAASFMSATLLPGMRAVSTAISTDTGAGGFILPNDRVDVLLTQQLSGQHNFATRTILSNVRVLAMDQTFGQDETHARRRIRNDFAHVARAGRQRRQCEGRCQDRPRGRRPSHGHPVRNNACWR